MTDRVTVTWQFFEPASIRNKPQWVNFDAPERGAKLLQVVPLVDVNTTIGFALVWRRPHESSIDEVAPVLVTDEEGDDDEA